MDDSILEARAVVARHEELVRARDVDGIVANMADDVVCLVPDLPLVEGKAAVRGLYEGMLASGAWEFRHEYGGAEAVGDLVVLHGIARGTMVPPAGASASLANNFVLTLRRQPDDQFRFWRIAFAPAGPES
jgi:ketosteroid isomerase-like protein